MSENAINRNDEKADEILAESLAIENDESKFSQNSIADEQSEEEKAKEPANIHKTKADKILEESLEIESIESNYAEEVVTYPQKQAYDQGRKLALRGAEPVNEFIKYFSRGVGDFRNEVKKMSSNPNDLIDTAKEVK